MTAWLAIVGVGEDGFAALAPTARALVANAETLVGGARHLALVPEGRAERLHWRSPLAATLPEIAARRGRRVVVLASGDPMCYGVGAMLARSFAPEEMIVLPVPSAFALAAARLHWPLEDCVTLSLHGRPLDALRLHLAPGARILALSTDGATPAQVAALLRDARWGPSTIAVLEHMGGPRERRLDGTAETWGTSRTADLNLLAIECRPGIGARAWSRLSGLPDDAFEHDGQLTKRETRAATLAPLAPLAGEHLWDVGAGSGAIAIEWLRAGPRLSAVAIERDPARSARIARNAAMLGVPELAIVTGEAPAALAGLRQPDAVFLGGGVGDEAIFAASWRALRMGGRLVANAVTLDGEAALATLAANHHGTLTRIAVSRAEPIGGHLAFRPLLAVTQLVLRKDRGRRFVIAAASRSWRPYALLVLLCLGLYLPGLATLPVTDRDEARFAQATRQMLESGDFLRIRFQDEARNKKPVAIYWLQAASVTTLSDAASSAIWPYRVPSLLGAVAAVVLTFAFGARLVGPPAALIGAGLLASSFGLTVEAHLAKTDAVLLVTCVAAQGALAEIYRARGRGGTARWALLFWAAQGVAILVKGPVAPALSLLTVLALVIADREWRWLSRLRPLWGVPLLVVIVAPWVVAINAATNGAFLGEALGQDFFGKLAGAQENDSAWPGYYLALVAVTFWPGSLLLGSAAAAAWRARSEDATRFLLAWVLPFWLVLELVPTKLPHYLLPVFPALALLAGRAALELGANMKSWPARAAAVVWSVASLVIVATLILAPVQLGHGIDAAGIVAGAIILIYGGRMVRLAWRVPLPGLAVRAVVLALLVLPIAFALEAPRLDPLWLSRDAARMVARFGPPADVPVAAVGYAEPSLVFLLGTRTLLVSPEIAAERITASRGAVALVEGRDDEAFQRALGARGWQALAVERVAGLDYSNGRRMVLTLYRGVPG